MHCVLHCILEEVQLNTEVNDDASSVLLLLLHHQHYKHIHNELELAVEQHTAVVVGKNSALVKVVVADDEETTIADNCCDYDCCYYYHYCIAEMGLVYCYYRQKTMTMMR